MSNNQRDVGDATAGHTLPLIDGIPTLHDTRTPSQIATHFLKTFFGNEGWKAKGLTASINPHMQGQSICFTSGTRMLDNFRVQQVFREELRKAGIYDVIVNRAGENKIWMNDDDVRLLEKALDANNDRAALFSAAVIGKLSAQGPAVGL